MTDEDNTYNTNVPASSLTTKLEINDDFEEVSIDGRSSSSVATTMDNSPKTSTFFICNPCKIYFPLEHMFEKHMKAAHSGNTSSRRRRKKKSKSILERLREKADGYRKNKDKSYVCNYCSYKSSTQSEISSHVGRKHGIFRKSVAVRTPTVTVAIESAIKEIKEELEDDIEIVNLESKIDPEVAKENTEMFEANAEIYDVNTAIFDANAEIMTEEIELIGEEVEMIDTGIEVVPEDTEFISVDAQIDPGEDESVAEIKDILDEREKVVVHQNKVYNCPYCQFQSKRRSIMHSHINKEHNSEWRQAVSYRDDTTTTTATATTTTDQKHKAYVPLERNHACYYCHFAATTRSTLNAHTRRKHPGYLQPARSRKQPPIEMNCDQCDFKTMDRHKMQMHIERKHVTECRFTCEYCGKKFKVKCDLTSHIRFQHFRTPTVCDVCGKLCSNSNALRVHQKREHYKPDFECGICKRRMVSQENLDEHIQRQHEQRIKYICEQCGKIFDQQNKLKQHTMTHTGERPHNCHLCGKSFARRAVFRQHLLIHTGQRPYVCDICGKSFTQKPGLICHRKMHPGDKPPLPVVYIDHILDKFVQKFE